MFFLKLLYEFCLVDLFLGFKLLFVIFELYLYLILLEFFDESFLLIKFFNLFFVDFVGIVLVCLIFEMGCWFVDEIVEFLFEICLDGKVCFIKFFIIVLILYSCFFGCFFCLVWMWFMFFVNLYSFIFNFSC